MRKASKFLETYFRKHYYKKLKNVSCEYDRLNGWNSTLQAAWYIRHVRWTCLFYISFIICFLWTKPTIWLLILSFTKYKKLKNVSCEYDRWNGWNSTLQAAWYIRHVRWTCYSLSFIIWCLWTKPTIWLLTISLTNFTEGRPRYMVVHTQFHTIYGRSFIFKIICLWDNTAKRNIKGTLGCFGIGLYLAVRAAYEIEPRFSFRFSVCFR